jgi:hypothetical protein
MNVKYVLVLSVMTDFSRAFISDKYSSTYPTVLFMLLKKHCAMERPCLRRSRLLEKAFPFREV